MIEALVSPVTHGGVGTSEISNLFSISECTLINFGKTNPLNDRGLAEFVELQKSFADTPMSWSLDVRDVDPQTFDLSVKNPNATQALIHRSPQEIMEEIAALDAESTEVLGRIRGLL